MAEAGFRHPHAFVLGTAGSTPVPPGGFYSPGAFWIGGAGGFVRGGFTSLVAFWMGGSSGYAPRMVPPPEEVEDISHVKVKRYPLRDEDDLLALIPCFLAVIEEDR